MADLPEPASRKEEFLATAAGATGIELPEPASREELYLKAIAEGGGGGGGGYVLPTASASTLGGVKVGNNLSIDGSGVLSAQTSVPIASVDTLGGVKVGENLSIDANGVLSAQGGGGSVIKDLTGADYNWNSTAQSATEPYNAVALWLLDPGFYEAGTGTTVLVDRTRQLDRREVAMVGRYNSSFSVVPIGLFFAEPTSEAGFQFGEFHSVLRNIGITTGLAPISEVVDDLTSEYTKAPLSANQGRILAERSNVLSPDAPGTDTEGVLGQLYTDTTNMHTYQCTAIDETGDEPVYTWTQRW